MARFGMGTVLGAGAAGAYGMQQVNQTGFSGFVHKFFPNMELPNMSPAIQSASNSAEVCPVTLRQVDLAPHAMRYHGFCAGPMGLGCKCCMLMKHTMAPAHWHD